MTNNQDTITPGPPIVPKSRGGQTMTNSQIPIIKDDDVGKLDLGIWSLFGYCALVIGHSR